MAGESAVRRLMTIENESHYQVHRKRILLPWFCQAKVPARDHCYKTAVLSRKVLPLGNYSYMSP